MREHGALSPRLSMSKLPTYGRSDMAVAMSLAGLLLIGGGWWLWLLITWGLPARKAEPVVERAEDWACRL